MLYSNNFYSDTHVRMQDDEKEKKVSSQFYNQNQKKYATLTISYRKLFFKNETLVI